MRKVLYILGQLDDGDIAWMARTGRRRQYDPGETLITEGVRTPDLFILLEGEVDITVSGVGAVARLGVGEILGEISFVDTAPPTATVTARRPVTALLLDKSAMSERLEADDAFAARFYRALAIFLADRLRSTTDLRRTGVALADTTHVDADELDEAVLDGVSLAGLRFHEMIRTLASDAPPAGVR